VIGTMAALHEGACALPAPAGCRVVPVPNKGYGMFTDMAYEAGKQVFMDEPVFLMQHTGNRRVVAACAHCCAFIGSLQHQLDVIFSESRFASIRSEFCGLCQQWQTDPFFHEVASALASNSVVRCVQGCGEVYCSEACRAAHFAHSHNLLCTGPIDREDHPLLRFKYHSLEHADTLLLAAQVLAHLINRAKASGGGVDVTRNLMSELLRFCHAPFRDACRAPPGRGKDADFFQHTDCLINEAAALLKAALEIHAPSETAALFEAGPAFFSEVLGLFEYNNIDVEVASPMGRIFLARAQALLSISQTPAATAELALLERLFREKEWVMKCVWGEETTGIYGDDVGPEAADFDMAMGGDVEDIEKFDAQVATTAMEKARIEVGKMTFEQLIQAPWPSLHGTALFASVARINHSCAPNLKVEFPMNSARLSAIALAPISPGSELCISYIGQGESVKVRRTKLLEYGFVCNCERCLQEDSSDVRKAQKRLK